MNITELQNRAISCIEKLPVSKLSSAIDYLEYLVERSEEEASITERLKIALQEVGRDRQGKLNLPTLEEVINELRD